MSSRRGMNDDAVQPLRDDDKPVAYPVKLGRDRAIRPFRVEPVTGKTYYQCVCCGAFTLDTVDECDICPECGWGDWYECLDSPNDEVRPNYISLAAAQSLCMRFGAGACSEANSPRQGAERIRDIEAMRPHLRAGLPTRRQRGESGGVRAPGTLAEGWPRSEPYLGECLVWVFHSSDAKTVHPCGVWSSKEKAESWIREVGANGILSAYVLDESAYDSCVRLGTLRLSKPERATAEFQRVFTSAVDHEHYESDGPPSAESPVPST